MKIQFHGATGDVTGSAYHVTTKRASVLVDCGRFQGEKREDRARKTLSELIRKRHGIRAALPQLGEVIEV